MKCPVCGAGLRPYSYAGQSLDACPGCRGMWFDPEELGALGGWIVLLSPLVLGVILALR